MVTEKRCSGCGEVKPLDAFHRHPNALGGRTNRCKPCKAEYERQYRARNADRLAARGLAYRQANREREAKRARAWAAANPERSRAFAKTYYEQRADELKAKAKAWREANPERKRENDKRWRAKNHEVVLDYSRAYRDRTKGDPEVRARRWARTKRNRAAFRAAIFERDGGICGLCGRPVSRKAFHIDHVIPVSLGGEHTVENMQIAHPRCNRSKGGRLS